jgi:hypothetical protein
MSTITDAKISLTADLAQIQAALDLAGPCAIRPCPPLIVETDTTAGACRPGCRILTDDGRILDRVVTPTIRVFGEWLPGDDHCVAVYSRESGRGLVIPASTPCRVCC